MTRRSDDHRPLQSGLHSRLDGVEYQVTSTFGWSLWSLAPAPGFTRRPGKTGYYHPIERNGRFPCSSISTLGSYRGVPVDVSGGGPGGYLLSTSDDRAGNAGFSQRGRAEWIKNVALDDRDLRYSTIRTPVPPPWERR